MDYIWVPSLEHNALTSVATTLWNQDDIKVLIGHYSMMAVIRHKKRKEWQIVEEKVREKVTNLLLPEPLKKIVLNFITPVGYEIRNWIAYHQSAFEILLKDSLDKLRWTSQGTLNLKKTAENLVRDVNLDIVIRYKLACVYCFEDYICALWKQLKDEQLHGKDLLAIQEKEFPLVSFWSNCMMAGLIHSDSIIGNLSNICKGAWHLGFKYAILSGNKVASEYFLQKLTPEEKKNSLVEAASSVAVMHSVSRPICVRFPKRHYADLLCSFLSCMNEEQQMELFKDSPQYVLKCLLDWQWKDFFIPTAECMLPFLSRSDCCDLLIQIIGNYNNYAYRRIFHIFSHKMPVSFKKYFIDTYASSLLCDLCMVGDLEAVKLVLQTATPFQKEGIIFSNTGKGICKRLVYDEKWDLLMIFIQECLPLKNLLVQFKESFKNEFAECIGPCESSEKHVKSKGKWDEFARLLDDLIQEFNKRKGTKDDQPGKRLCS